MAALNQDTRLVMTILFCGCLSGANVFFYAQYGIGFPYSHLAHAVLFGLVTVGAIMIMKAIGDLFLNDRIELFLLDRKIEAYWARMSRDEQQRKKLVETSKQFTTDFNTVPQFGFHQNQNNEVSADFLAKLQ